MSLFKKPYLIIPELIEQPTWGGNYIVNIKQLRQPFLENKKIGQSYELYGQSKLLMNINNPRDPKFSIDSNRFKKNIDFVVLQEELEQPMKVLIKLTQALGNSFQLHIKPEKANDRWRSKAESWYYLQDGLATLGIQPNCDLRRYREVCLLIEKKMQELSQQIIEKKVNLATAKLISQKYIQELNPWQFVNLVKINKNSLVDLSACGIHHSWEENHQQIPDGNIVYEVQQDVSDDASSLRSFDKGKFKNDGNIRPVYIADYFRNLDPNPESNLPENLIKQPTGENLVTNTNYCLDIMQINTKRTIENKNTFQHLFVKEGEIEVAAPDGKVILPSGFSCFIPSNLHQYEVICRSSSAIILKTYI